MKTYRVYYRRTIEGYMDIQAASRQNLRARLAEPDTLLDLWHGRGVDESDNVKVREVKSIKAGGVRGGR